MRRIAILLFLLLVAGPAAVADDEPPETAPSPSAAVQQALDAVLAASRAGNEGALQTLAARNEPDPWIVADLLCHRGERKVAAAFAEAAPRPDTKALRAYVHAWRERPVDEAGRNLIPVLAAAMTAGRFQRVLDATAAGKPALDTVVGIRLQHLRAAAHAALEQHAEAKVSLRRTADAALALGWLQRAQVITHLMATGATRASDHPAARALFEEGYALAQRRGHKDEAAGRLGNIGATYYAQAEFAKALVYFERCLDLAEEIGHRQFVLFALRNMSNAYRALGDTAKALATYERSKQVLARSGAPGDRQERAAAATALAGSGRSYMILGEYAMALATFEQVKAQWEALGDKVGAARALASIGRVHQRVGDFAKALSRFEQARAQMQALGRTIDATRTLGSIGAAYAGLGDYGKALSAFEQTLARQQALGDELSVAVTLGNLANVYSMLGDYVKALSIQETALAQKVALGDKAGAAQTLGNIGDIYLRLEDPEKALAAFEQALAQKAAMGDKASAPRTLAQIGTVHKKLGDHARALSTFRRALAQQEAIGDKEAVAGTLGEIGDAYRLLGDFAQARAYLDRSARAARSLRATGQWVRTLSRLARMHLDGDEPSRALAAAQKALTAMEGILGGLGEEQGATAREQYADLYAVGTLAAVRDGDVAQALAFLESGRAGALLDTLDKREALRWKAESLPPALRRLDLQAQDEERRARRVYDAAARRGALKPLRVASQALDAATETVREVEERIQRDLKQQAGLFYPRADTIEEIEASLRDDQALVLYGLFLNDRKNLDEALALVLRPEGERVVALGKASAIAVACEALDATSSSSDPTAALATLRKLLIEPLKLEPKVRQVLVSPEGPLCYLPFGALFDRTVAMTPSGTTHGLLLGEERAQGEGILALGDADYGTVSKGAQALHIRSGKLTPLPATRKEAETIGTTTLLGALASEAGLRAALPASARWRAIHFACHGMVNIDRPMQSTLALSRTGEDDGFLTAREILRMRIPADLAVLSACQTAKGKIVKGEGIVGLTRAFMFAGAPRVLCSLWKVDDEATQAMMIKFYELWNPATEKGLGAAEALRGAQAFVRSQARWQHPYYWAAWVLWGLPD